MFVGLVEDFPNNKLCGRNPPKIIDIFGALAKIYFNTNILLQSQVIVALGVFTRIKKLLNATELS